MSRAEGLAGYLRFLAREIADPDISAEELGRCVLVLEWLVDAGAVLAEEADDLLAPIVVGERG